MSKGGNMFETDSDTATNKLTILYIIKIGEGIFNKKRLAGFILDGGYLNYFLIFQYLEELLSSRIIDETEDGFYYLPHEGMEILELFESHIDEELKSDIDNRLKGYDFEKVPGTIPQGKVKFLKHSAMVRLILIRDGECIFNLEFETEKEKAQGIVEGWNKNYKDLYRDFVSVIEKI